jgi:hypothetical protein
VSNAKNYQTQGGDKWVVEGELEITPKGKLLLHHREVTPMTAQENSQATTIAALREDFNTLLKRLKDAGLMKTQ